MKHIPILIKSKKPTFKTLLVTVSESESAPVNITGGPLQYTYRYIYCPYQSLLKSKLPKGLLRSYFTGERMVSQAQSTA